METFESVRKSNVRLKSLELVRASDNSGYVVTYEHFGSNGWVMDKVNFDSTSKLGEFIKGIERDFNKRIIWIEKRVVTYERWE